MAGCMIACLMRTHQIARTLWSSWNGLDWNPAGSCRVHFLYIDVATDTVTGTFEIGDNPNGTAFTPDLNNTPQSLPTTELNKLRIFLQFVASQWGKMGSLCKKF